MAEIARGFGFWADRVQTSEWMLLVLLFRLIKVWNCSVFRWFNHVCPRKCKVCDGWNTYFWFSAQHVSQLYSLQNVNKIIVHIVPFLFHNYDPYMGQERTTHHRHVQLCWADNDFHSPEASTGRGIIHQELTQGALYATWQSWEGDLPPKVGRGGWMLETRVLAITQCRRITSSDPAQRSTGFRLNNTWFVSYHSDHSSTSRWAQSPFVEYVHLVKPVMLSIFMSSHDHDRHCLLGTFQPWLAEIMHYITGRWNCADRLNWGLQVRSLPVDQPFRNTFADPNFL